MVDVPVIRSLSSQSRHGFGFSFLPVAFRISGVRGRTSSPSDRNSFVEISPWAFQRERVFTSTHFGWVQSYFERIVEFRELIRFFFLQSLIRTYSSVPPGFAMIVADSQHWISPAHVLSKKGFAPPHLQHFKILPRFPMS
jgi:hypothetical protein